MKKYHFAITIVGNADKKATADLIGAILSDRNSASKIVDDGDSYHEVKGDYGQASVKISIRKLNDKTGELTNGEPQS